MKKSTTCKKCNRVVWAEDVGEERLCCFCKPKETGVFKRLKRDTKILAHAGEVAEIKPKREE
jgi:hypothetical protein